MEHGAAEEAPADVVRPCVTGDAAYCQLSACIWQAPYTGNKWINNERQKSGAAKQTQTTSEQQIGARRAGCASGPLCAVEPAVDPVGEGGHAVRQVGPSSLQQAATAGGQGVRQPAWCVLQAAMDGCIQGGPHLGRMLGVGRVLKSVGREGGQAALGPGVRHIALEADVTLLSPRRAPAAPGMG